MVVGNWRFVVVVDFMRQNNFDLQGGETAKV